MAKNEIYKTNPFILACIEILGPIWDKQIDELEKKGARIRYRGTIYERNKIMGQEPQCGDDKNLTTDKKEAP